MNLKTIIFIGRSGCGKGTQVKRMVEDLSDQESFHLEAGQHFREFIGNGGNHSSELAKQVSEEGGLQPEFLSIWAWTSELVDHLGENTNLFIDGTPRRRSEAIILESALEFYGRTKVDVVYINVSRDSAVDRLIKRGRADDVDRSDIERRMNWFETDVVPVLDYYRGHKSFNFHEIDGDQDIEKVHADIIKSLE